MATIKDVAKMAGVSTTTVSHVINKTRFVAKETEEAVMQAIKSLKYSPSAVARSLKVNTTKSIGMIVPPVNPLILLKSFMPLKIIVIVKVIHFFCVIHKMILKKLKITSKCSPRNA